MKQKTIAAIALSNRDFPTFAAKLAEAVHWVEFAAKQGAELAVLPETINLWRGDGPGNPNALTYAEAALDDWQKQTAPLIEAARRLKIGVTVPVVVREGRSLWNSCFFISRTGKVVGRYDKINPTISELEQGVLPGKAKLIEWEGLRVGGAICFDTEFQEIFEQQAALGAQLFVVPSLSPGGRPLNHYASRYGTPLVIAYPAWSRILNYDGTELAAGGYRWETLRFGFGAPVLVATINFDYVVLHADGNQEKMVDVQRKYGHQVRLRFDQDNTLFYVESLAADLTVADVVKEFSLVPIREYFTRYHQVRAKYAAD
jgi:predicted amidohydrolase